MGGLTGKTGVTMADCDWLHNVMHPVGTSLAMGQTNVLYTRNMDILEYWDDICMFVSRQVWMSVWLSVSGIHESTYRYICNQACIRDAYM